MITRKAYAKLNLTLDILGKREDGYHDLSMVMQSISLCDTLHVSLTDGTDILCRVEGEEMVVGFNNKFLLDALRAAASYGKDEVLFELNSPLSGMAIRSTETDAFYYMVVPMRLN